MYLFSDWAIKREFLLAQSVLEDNNTRSLRVMLELTDDDDQAAQKRRQTLIEGSTLRGKSGRTAAAELASVSTPAKHACAQPRSRTRTYTYCPAPELTPQSWEEWAHCCCPVRLHTHTRHARIHTFSRA